MTGKAYNFPGGFSFVPLGVYNDDLYGILVDASGHLQVDVLSLTGLEDLATEVTLQAVRDRIGALTGPAAGSVNAQLASAVTALQLIDDFALGTNKLFGYYDRYSEREYLADAVAGTNILAGTTVPAGEIWVIQMMAAIDANSVITAMFMELNDTVATGVVHTQAAPSAGVWYAHSGQWIIKAGDNVQVTFTGCIANDDLYAHFWGYKMKIS